MVFTDAHLSEVETKPQRIFLHDAMQYRQFGWSVIPNAPYNTEWLDPEKEASDHWSKGGRNGPGLCLRLS